MSGSAGYATAVMAALGLAVSLVAASLVTRSMAEFRAGQSDIERLQVSYDLDAAQTQAVVTLMRDGANTPLAWRVEAGGRAIDVLAEPEARKVPAALASVRLGPKVLEALGVGRSATLTSRLGPRGSQASHLSAVADASETAAWRQCAPSLISYFGGGVVAPGISVSSPRTGQFRWLVGEVWRIRAKDRSGWQDDRLVRFTGAPQNPVAIIDRQLSRDRGPSVDCARLVGERSP